MKNKRKSPQTVDYSDLSVSIVVPAYNEEVSIVNCVEMLRCLEYDNYEIIVVNDGSKDNTLGEILEYYNPIPLKSGGQGGLINTKAVLEMWTVQDKRVIIIDKENGGKADAINSAINISSKQFICTIDADSILDSRALKRLMPQFAEHPETFVAGGQLAASNGVIIKNSKVESLKMPQNFWVLWQITEYIKSFLISRVGLGKFNSLLVMSGAFSVFRKNDLIEVGGYLSGLNNHKYIIENIGTFKKTLCEDMEIVIRLWKYHRDMKQKTKAVFLPQPVCWTEVPDNRINLYKQRVRWHTGLAESLVFHINMMFDTKYKSTGLFAMPYYFLFELLSPLIKLITLVFIILASITGLINFTWLIMLIVGTTLITAILTSTMTVFTEYWSYSQDEVNRSALRYRSFWNWALLMGSSVIGDFTYAYFRSFAQLNGLWNYAINKKSWNKFERKGVQRV